MLLTVLGCSGSIPGPGAAASGYLVEADGFTLALEFGNGVLSRSAKAACIRPKSADRIGKASRTRCRASNRGAAFFIAEPVVES